ncbi:uncharacterized protein LOC117929291 isoform X3 [Vitis riparia]|uniref:uncharacterized protein LOC117929291 isoform X3 n=1 Tax=Vitis riparia TaxID=96939 RepID=UPI00155AD88F|nr:uncharacterized protein LOC117929291 isoform X3 [Vitis riparia]
MEMLLDRLVSFDLLKRLEKVLLKIHVVVNKAEEKQICISEICSAYGVERSKDKKGFISFMNMCILSDYWKFCLLLHEEGFPLMEEMKELKICEPVPNGKL